MRSTRSVVTKTCLLLLTAATAMAWSAAARADYIWMQRDGNGAHAYIGELERPLTPAAGGLTTLRAYLADGMANGKDLPLAVQDRDYAITAPASGDIRVLASRVSADGVLHYYQARYGRTETKPVNDLELVPTTANGNTFKLIWKGNVVPASQVNVVTSAGWRRTLKPAADGAVTLATPFPGLYVLEITARLNGSVTVDGKQYENVHHTATLSFEVGS